MMWNTEGRSKTLFPHPVTPYVAENESGCRHVHTFPGNRKGIVESSLKKKGRGHASEEKKATRKMSHGYFQQKCFKCSELWLPFLHVKQIYHCAFVLFG